MEEKLYIYIDESGDTGIKFDKGSSRFFVLALVFVKKDEMESVSRDVELIVSDIYENKSELKFSKTSFKNKIIFFKFIKKVNFEARVCIFNKSNLDISYEEYIIRSLRESVNLNKKYIVYIDGLNKKNFSEKSISMIKKSFRNIKKVQLLDSKKNYLIQLADMIVGLVHSIYKDKKDYDSILETLKNKIKITHFK